MKSQAKRACEICRAEFVIKSSKPNQKYCSKECADQGKRKKPDVKCLICGQIFVSSANAPNKYCSRACRVEASRRQDTRKCLHCEQEFMVVHSRPNQYCSSTCAHAATGIKSRKAYPIRVCDACGKEFEHRRYDTAGKYCSRACSDKVNKVTPAQPWIEKACIYCGEPFLCPPWSPQIQCCSALCANRQTATWRRGEQCYQFKGKVRVICVVCGKEKLVHPYRAETARTCSRRCSGLLSQMQMPRSSNLERIVLDALIRAGLNPEPLYILKYYTIDLALPECRLAIEVDGDYWHSTPKQKSKDKAKDTFLRGRGWHVLRLPEYKIKASLEACVQAVIDKIESIRLSNPQLSQ